MPLMKYTREAIQEDHIPESYRWWIHLGLIAIWVTTTGAFSIYMLQEVAVWQWMAFVGAILVFNAGEYWIHRGPFHHPMGTQDGYFRHTLMHHNYFTHETMAVEGGRDLKWVVVPAWGYPAICVVFTPLMVGLYFVQPNLCWLFLLALSIYYTTYEILHTLAHLPESSWLAKNRIIIAVCHHHTVHHDPKLMEKYNFNFGLPVFDWILLFSIFIWTPDPNRVFPNLPRSFFVNLYIFSDRYFFIFSKP